MPKRMVRKGEPNCFTPVAALSFPEGPSFSSSRRKAGYINHRLGTWMEEKSSAGDFAKTLVRWLWVPACGPGTTDEFEAPFMLFCHTFPLFSRRGISPEVVGRKPPSENKGSQGNGRMARCTRGSLCSKGKSTGVQQNQVVYKTASTGISTANG